MSRYSRQVGKLLTAMFTRNRFRACRMSTRKWSERPCREPFRMLPVRSSPGANISIKEVSTGVSREAISDSVGFYSVPNLTAGSYEVTISAAGFFYHGA